MKKLINRYYNTLPDNYELQFRFANHLFINVHSCDVDNYDEAAGCGVVFCRTRIGYLKRILNCQLLVKYTNKQYSEYIE